MVFLLGQSLGQTERLLTRLLRHTTHGKAVVLAVAILRGDVARGIQVQVVAVVGIVDGRRPPAAVRADVVQLGAAVVAGVEEARARGAHHIAMRASI